MESRHCYFAKKPPTIKVRGDLLFIIPDGAPCEIAVSPSTMRQFISAANEALAKWQVAQLDRVVEFPGRH